MIQPSFPHLLTPERLDQYEQLEVAIEKIAQAVMRFNSMLRDAGSPTPPISIRHKGKEMSCFSGEITVSMDLQQLRLLDKMDRINLMHPAPPKRRAA